MGMSKNVDEMKPIKDKNTSYGEARWRFYHSVTTGIRSIEPIIFNQTCK